MTKIVDPADPRRNRRVDFKSKMRLPHIVCPECKGNHFRVCVASIPSFCKILLDCSNCKHRVDLWMSAMARRGEAREAWESIEYSDKFDVIVKPRKTK